MSGSRHGFVICTTVAFSLLVVAAPAAQALNFFFNSYGGFTDPSEISPTTPSSEFTPDFDFEELNGFDTDVTAWQKFCWGTTTCPAIASGSYLTINEAFPHAEPEIFFDHLTGPVTTPSSRRTRCS